MSSPRVVSDNPEKEFWIVVEQCLHAFHAMKPVAIRTKTKTLRDTIERMTSSECELFYHSEPFDVACELAGNQLNIDEYLDRYIHIRDEQLGNGIRTNDILNRSKARVKK